MFIIFKGSNTYDGLNVLIKFATNFVIYYSLYFIRARLVMILIVMIKFAPNFVIYCSLYFRTVRLMIF